MPDDPAQNAAGSTAQQGVNPIGSQTAAPTANQTNSTVFPVSAQPAQPVPPTPVAPQPASPPPPTASQPSTQNNASPPPTDNFVYSSMPTPIGDKQPRRKLLLKLIFLVVLALVLIGGSLGGFFVFRQSKQEEVKELAGQQLTNFANLESGYAKIIEVVKRDPMQGQSPESEQLLGVTDTVNTSDQEVLGLEDDPDVIKTRELTELYRQSAKILFLGNAVIG